MIEPLPVPLGMPSHDRRARVRRVGGLTVWTETLTIRSRAPRDFMDVTDRVADVVDRAGITEGWVGLFSKHTTAAVVINENEPLLLADMAAMLERLSATDATYGHNDFTIRTVNMHADECANGHAHCQHLLLSSSQSVPLADGHLDLGEWQRIFFLELDRPRERQFVVQVFGI